MKLREMSNVDKRSAVHILLGNGKEETEALQV